MANLIPRRRSRTQKAKRAVTKAAKGAAVTAVLAKARRPLAAIAAVGGGALLVRRLTSGSGDQGSPA